MRRSWNDNWMTGPNPELFDMGRKPDLRPVTLPHDAMVERERSADAGGKGKKGYFPEGAYAYFKKFDVPADWHGKRVSIEFEGVYMNAMVYINGSFAGQHPYGYSRFCIKLDRFLKYGEENEIKVLSFTQDDSRWYSGAGIYRNVWIRVNEPTHLIAEGIRVSTPEIGDDHAVVMVETTLENEGMNPQAARIHTELLAADGTVVASDLSPLTVFAGERDTLRQRIRVEKPLRWSVESPNLYTCRVRVLDGSVGMSGSDGSASVAGTDGNTGSDKDRGANPSVEAETAVQLDSETVSFGIRSLSLDATEGLKINGEVVKLRGCCIHHDNGIIGAATIARAEERRVERLKAAGFNAIRSAHHPMSAAMLDACDRLGMLVMDETFDMWTLHKSSQDYAGAFPDWWERDVESMVHKDFNHPSVILYSIGNEIPETGTAHGAALGRKQTAKIRSLDETRYVINSINLMLAVMDKMKKQMQQAFSGDINTMLIDIGDAMKQMSMSQLVTDDTAESFAAVDVAGYNYADSRYLMDKSLFPNRVICGSETFPRDIAGNWKLVMENGHLIGDFTWTGWDYLGEAGIGKTEYDAASAWSGGGSAWPWLTAWCGDIDITGFRRPVSYWREIVFGLRTEPYIAVLRPQFHGRKPKTSPWGWSDSISSWSWEGFEGKPVTVEVYADADEVELLLNGVSIGRSAVGEKRAFIAELETSYASGELTAIARRGGREIGRTSLNSAGSELQLKLEVDRAVIDASDADLAYVEISLVDASGIVKPLADRSVTVAVEGAGSLQGFGSGSPISEERFGDGVYSTFDGRALAVVRPRCAGSITVCVEAEGCAPQRVTIEAVVPA